MCLSKKMEICSGKTKDQRFILEIKVELWIEDFHYIGYKKLE